MMRHRKTKSKCTICGKEGDGFHFGVETCKACAVFFHRSVNRTFHCNGNNNCDITANIRCMCRSCRFAKCLKMGMNPLGVQQRIDMKSNQSIIFPELIQIDQMPILMKMREKYQKLKNARIVIHRKEGESLFEERVPKAIDYLESVKQAMKDVSLVADWISWCFEDFVNLPIDQKNALFRNFYVNFFILEGAFRSHTNKTPNRMTMPSGDYIDIDRLELFYKIDGDQQPMSKEEIDRLFKSGCEMHRRSLILPMIRENLDIFEFFSLSTILLWDIDMEKLSEETQKSGRQIKDRVMKECAFYMRNYKRIEEPVVRIANIMGLIPAVYKSTRRVQDDMEITKIFEVYVASREFYDLISGNFC